MSRLFIQPDAHAQEIADREAQQRRAQEEAAHRLEANAAHRAARQAKADELATLESRDLDFCKSAYADVVRQIAAEDLFDGPEAESLVESIETAIAALQAFERAAQHRGARVAELDARKVELGDHLFRRYRHGAPHTSPSSGPPPSVGVLWAKARASFVARVQGFAAERPSSLGAWFADGFLAGVERAANDARVARCRAIDARNAEANRARTEEELRRSGILGVTFSPPKR